MMDTKAIAQRTAARIKAQHDPEWAWLMFLHELAHIIEDLARRPDDYRQAIERYALTMPPENAAYIREHFPYLLAWSERGLGTYPHHLPAHRPRRNFGDGCALDPLVWCYYDHDHAQLDLLNTIAMHARRWVEMHPAPDTRLNLRQSEDS